MISVSGITNSSIRSLISRSRKSKYRGFIIILYIIIIDISSGSIIVQTEYIYINRVSRNLSFSTSSILCKNSNLILLISVN